MKSYGLVTGGGLLSLFFPEQKTWGESRSEIRWCVQMDT